MKVNLINNINQNNYSVVRHRSSVPNNLIENSTDIKQKVYASNLCFKSGAPLTALYNDYKWFINHDKTPAIDSLLKIVAPAEKFESLVNIILSNKKDCFQLFDSIVEKPREINSIYNQLIQKLPSMSKTIFMPAPDCKIKLAYKDYIEERYRNASSIEELIKIRPDWSGKALLNKHRELNGDKNFTLGKVPDDIGKDNFVQILQFLRSYRQSGFKSNHDIEDLFINNRTFKFKPIVDGKTEKNVYEIKLENGKKYVIKIAPEDSSSLEKSSALGTCSKVDYYLTLHNCRNSAPLKYYDHNNNAIIYDYINHDRIDRIPNLNEIKKNMPDYIALGLNPIDNVGDNNFFLLNKYQSAMIDKYNFDLGVQNGKELIAVDNDIIDYTHNSSLHPQVSELFKTLPGERYMGL